MTEKSRWLWAWLAASIASLLVALAPAYAALADGHYIPVGNDAFYHARRILEMLADPASLHEFDRRIHVPEGSLLIWPWGYDYLMSLIVRVGLALGLSRDPMAILDHIPVFAFPVSLVLLLAACRQLGLSAGAGFAALLAMALFPLNQALYAVGNVDHHFAEQLFVLASLAAGMAWLHSPDSRARAICLGVVLGISHCIHNGLFILQLPIVAALAVMWARGMPRPRTTWVFAAALLASTLAVSLPSTSVRLVRFEFFTLSWFHVYFAACVGIGCLLFERTRFAARSALVIVATGVLMSVPVPSQILLAQKFLSVSIEGAEQISEQLSVWEFARSGMTYALRVYSPFVLILPLTLLLCGWRLWRETEPRRCLFWISCLFGLVLLAGMVRMHPYGSFALSLPWIVVADEYFRSRNQGPRTAGLALTLAIVLIVAAPGFRILFKDRKPPGGNPYYALNHELFARLGQECASRPGVALSNLDDGNYIRFHTDCPIIANNFLLTPQHEAKVREVRALLALPAGQLAQHDLQVKYVLVRRSKLYREKEGGGVEFVPGGNPEADPALVNELLDSAPDRLPSGFRLIQELAFEKPQHIPYARLFAIER